MRSLSLCLIVRDDADHLRRCLQSAAPAVDEMIVVDTGSTDASAAVARAAGATVATCPWREDFSAARNAALDLATGDWVLVLDADEALEAGSAARLRAVVAEAARRGYETVAIELRDLAPDGRPVASFLQNKLWRRSPTVRYRGRIHEVASVRLPAFHAGLVAHHHGYAACDPVRRQAKHQRNLRLLRLDLQETPDDPRLRYHLAKEQVLAGDDPAAIASAEAALAAHRRRGEPPVAGLFLLLALAAQRAGNLAEATARISAGLHEHPDHFDLHFVAAELCRQAGDAPGMRRHAAAYLEHLAAWRRGESLAAERQFACAHRAGAIHLLLAADRLTAGDPDAALRHAAAARAEGEDDAAVQWLAQAAPSLGKDRLLATLRDLAEDGVTPPLRELLRAVAAQLGPEDIDFLRFAVAAGRA